MDKIHAFYTSSAWRGLAYHLKIERGGRCSKCGEVIEDFSKLIGHHAPIHLTEDNVDDPAISLNPDDVEIDCLDCHNREHRRFGYQKQVYIVWGSPMSGKTTLVRQMMQAGDLVLDIDALWQAVTFQPEYSKPAPCRFNVFALRDSLLDQIKTRYGQWGDAYVIGGYPEPFERQRLADRLGAQLLYCESTRKECLTRVSKGNRPVAWSMYVNDWWDQFERSAHLPPGGADFSVPPHTGGGPLCAI